MLCALIELAVLSCAALRRAGKSQKITITNDKGRLSKEEIERMVQVTHECEQRTTGVQCKLGKAGWMHYIVGACQRPRMATGIDTRFGCAYSAYSRAFKTPLYLMTCSFSNVACPGRGEVPLRG